jgi:hypothetical protein
MAESLRHSGCNLVVIVANIGASAQPNTVDAISSGGRGVLTKRIDWLVTSSRRTYHHIRLPARIAVGDTITLYFGSSTKTYAFAVARITLTGVAVRYSARKKFIIIKTRLSSRLATRPIDGDCRKAVVQ